ncbi:MAG: hypothetical protein GY863_02520 [bacterium]|nr:hypothetical protein [bacterium]
MNSAGKTARLILLISLLITISCAQEKVDPFPVLTGPYLGQDLPGNSPLMFARGIVSTGMAESNIAVMPDGMEIYFTNLSTGCETLIMTKFENGKWTAPEVAPFSGKYLDGFPSIMSDGSKMFFHSFRPLDGSSTPSEKVNIWYVERVGSGWGEPKPVGPPINGEVNVTGPSVAHNGNLYFCKQTKDGAEKVYRSRYVNGEYMEPELLPDNVNTMQIQFHTYISPDESFLILPVNGRDDAINNSMNYYVSFRDNEDNWSDLINLGETINTGWNGAAPSISSDGKYFFFEGYPRFDYHHAFENRMTYADIKEFTIATPANRVTDIFWIDVKIITDLRPDNFK